MMKALIYRRISTNDTKQDIERQKEPISNFCKNKGFEVVGEFRDAITGSTKAATREGYSELLKYVENYDGDKKSLNVVFDEVSRLGRNKLDILQECEKFTNQNINVHIVNPSVTLLDNQGNINNEADLVITLYAQQAQNELRTLQARIKSSIQRTVTKGHSLGGVELYGYMNDNKKLVIHPEESLIVKKVFDMFINNTSTYKIATYLNNTNTPTRKQVNDKKWVPTLIARQLKNKQYTGIRIVNGIEYEAPELRIIDNETFNKVQDIFKNKINYSLRERKSFNPLIKLFRCGCEKTIVISENMEKKNVYKCASVYYANKCDVFSTVRFEKTNNVIATAFSSLLFQIDDNIDYKENLNNELKRIKEIDLPIIEDGLNKIQSKLEKVIDLIVDGMISKEKGIERQSKIKEDEIELKLKLDGYNDRIDSINKELEALEMKGDLFVDLDLPKFKYYVNKVIKSIRIYKDSTIKEISDFKHYFRTNEVPVRLEILTHTNIKKTIYYSSFCKYLFIRTDNISKLITSFEVENGGDNLQLKKVGDSLYTIIKIEEIFV